MSTLLGASLAAGACLAEEKAVRIYIGTYTDGKCKGIYTSQLDLATGGLTPPELAAEV
jgi:hypothetical protein